MPETKALVSTKDFIIIKGAKVHNLKNINVNIPRNKFVVITGLSGSGKSSLAFDTLFAEGQRRYVESLSSYARQFLGKIEKPNVEHIYGISPAIAIEQKVVTSNKRSTVGTSTEIYDYLKLLFTRIGKTISPVSGKEVTKDTPVTVANYIINNKNDGDKFLILSPLKKQSLSNILQQGFSRIFIDNKILPIDDFLKTNDDEFTGDLLIDRLIVNKSDEDFISRLTDSLETAFFEGKGACKIAFLENDGKYIFEFFNNKFELDGITFEEPSEHFFSFNNPLGACKRCEGYGSIIGIDEHLVVPNKHLSVYEDAVVCWKGEKMQEWKQQLINNAHKCNFPVHTPYYKLTDKEKEALWNGNEYFEGINDFFKFVEEQSYKIQYRVLLSRYRGKTTCPDCKGTRLRKDAGYVKVNGKSIQELVLMSVEELLKFFNEIRLSDYEQQIAKRILTEITNRLAYLENVGLGYLTLNRLSSTLSGGESQRINLATSLGSALVGSLYILDEPSIGLHSKDTEKLIAVLKALKKLGNTVIVVEHDEEIIEAAEEIIDMGPEAGINGGEVVFQGDHNALKNAPNSLTADYLTGRKQIKVPDKRRSWKKYIELKNVRENNLKGFDVKFPLNVMTVVTGVSGSGKSSLIKGCLIPAVKKMFDSYIEKTGEFENITGNIDAINTLEFINQNPIGKSSRSNPITYIKAYDEIRTLFAQQKLAKIRGFKPAHFSFNVEGGRCETCKGEGVITVEMQFMADIHLTCEDCKGKRFKEDILEIKYKGKNISEILELSIDEAIEFFNDSQNKTVKNLLDKLITLSEVGLGYLALGQASSTLSGGEAQRVKLASFLIKKNTKEKILFVFDEPTTGLHFHDIQKLLKAFNALIAQGHSIIIIEHNLDVIKCADWIIDLGPEGGDKGGYLLFEGTPEDLIQSKASITGQFLKKKL
ncbi:MAG: excinuclease ABC subunit UvrA [Vicingaceae bacterium]